MTFRTPNWTRLELKCTYTKKFDKISRTLGVMNRLKRYLPTEILRVLYISLILPHLRYAILSWGSKLSRLSNLQKRAIRFITCNKFNAHTEPLFKSLKLLKLEHMLSPSILKLYNKLCHGDLPVYIMNLFTRIVPGSTHDYNLRPSGIFEIPTVHTCVVERCIRFMLPEIINDNGWTRNISAQANVCASFADLPLLDPVDHQGPVSI